MTYNTKAFVLKSQPWREADRLYTLYTEQFGKQTVRAQGVRKLNAKLAGALEPFAEVDAFIIEAKQINKLGGAVVQERLANLSTNLGAGNAAWFCYEVLDRLTQDNLPDPALYTLLYSVLVWLNHNGVQRLVVYSFVIKLIRLLGYHLVTNNSSLEMHKIATWLEQQPFEQIQKLRLSAEHWTSLLSIIHSALEDHLSSPMQSEKFLV